MPSARSTLAIVAALVYGTSVLAMPLENPNDLVDRDYSDVAELDARMFDMDLEEFYVRSPSPDTTSELPTHKPKGHGKHRKSRKAKKAAAAAAAAAEVPTAPTEVPATREVDDEILSAREPKGGKGKGRRGRKGRGRKGRGGKGKGGKGKGKGGKGKGGVADAPPSDAAEASPAEAPAEAPAQRDVSDEMLSTREPKGGKGRGGKGRKGRGRKGKGRKGRGRKGGKGRGKGRGKGKGKGNKAAAAAEAPPADAGAPPAEAAAEPPAAEAPAARDLFTRVADDEKTPSESTPKSEVKAESPAPAHKKKTQGRVHRVHRHRLGSVSPTKKVKKPTPVNGDSVPSASTTP